MSNDPYKNSKHIKPFDPTQKSNPLEPTQDTQGDSKSPQLGEQPEQVKSLPLMWGRGNHGRLAGSTFDRFMQCLQWAKEGKTYIYYHPDFVAIDMKSWEAINNILHPPKKTIIYYDEYDEMTPEKEAILNKWLSQRLAKTGADDE